MRSLLQTQEWATVKESQGWRVHWVEEILVLEKRLPLGLSFLYAPEVDFYKIKKDLFLAKIKEIAKKNKAIFTRLDLINQKSSKINEKIPKILTNFGFVKSFEEIQPEFRQIVNISGSEEQILAQMKPKGRYNIKVAQKNGVAVEKAQNIDDFYEIFKETAERDGFQVRPKKYFEDLYKILHGANLVEVFVTRYNGKAIAAGIFTFFDEMSSYLYGASSNEDRQVMAPYLMHLEAIREAKERGCNFYDLLAVSPWGEEADKKLVDKYAGITRFKEQFGGLKIQTIGSWDLAHKPLWYWLFKMAEKMRRH
jgi:lipid II:glycine glycyltransferase (peptidoglycan interpeptide bridge formation enzyme)